MNIPDPEEIVEARSLLAQAENETNPKRKVEELKEGIDLLDLYVEENTDIPEAIKTRITNIRRSHTRRLLSQLLSTKIIEIEVWLEYVLLLMTKLKTEMEFATENDPELKKNYDEFWNLYSEDLKKVLKDHIK